MKSFICLLTGHKYNFFDDENGVCKRCLKEFSLDMDSYESGFVRKNHPSLSDIIRYLASRLFYSCPYCRKIKYFLGIHFVKGHSKCAPF